MSRQQRRARERGEAKHRVFERVHARVIGSRSIQEIWQTYYDERFRTANIPPDGEQILKETFYSGVAAMLELMNRVSPDDVTEERGVEMLQRLYDELETFTHSLR